MKNKVNVNGDPRALKRLKSACKRAKIILSYVVTTSIEVDNLFKASIFILQ